MPDSPDQRTDALDDPAVLSAEILALLAKMTERFDSAENEEWRWLIEHSPRPLIVEILRDSTPMALRVIDAIGRMEPVNGITISSCSGVGSAKSSYLGALPNLWSTAAFMASSFSAMEPRMFHRKP